MHRNEMWACEGYYAVPIFHLLFFVIFVWSTLWDHMTFAAVNSMDLLSNDDPIEQMGCYL